MLKYDDRPYSVINHEQAKKVCHFNTLRDHLWHRYSVAATVIYQTPKNDDACVLSTLLKIA